MRFTQLLPSDARILNPANDPEVTSIAYDSRLVTPGALFLAIKGESTDGKRFVSAALERGAVAIVTDGDAPFPPHIAHAVIPHGRRSMAHIASTFYNHPERQLTLNGVTGTNGKTTTTFLLNQLLAAAGRTTALIGTVEYRIASATLPAPHTTPESLDLFALLRRAADARCTEVTMEVSSHALHQGRVWSLVFDTAIFTNLTQDHLDYHGTMEDYFEAKRLLFEGSGGPAPRVAITNVDDPSGRRLMFARGVAEVRTYGIHDGDFRATNPVTNADGIRFDWQTPFGTFPIRSRLIGSINIYNLLAAMTAAHARRVSPEQIIAAAESLAPVPGRFERVDCGQPFTVIVDYAHTDDALSNVLRIARELVGTHRIITVFGCGGDRDKTKRPKMGHAAATLSDFTIVTSDNPRSEDPLAIIADITPALDAAYARYTTEPDRRAAIALALRQAQPGDLVLIAGKGHEKTQTIGAQILPFDDVAVVKQLLSEK